MDQLLLFLMLKNKAHNKMKNKLLILLMFTIGCNKQNKIDHLIDGGGTKYWDIIDTKGNTQYCYSFSKNGDCKYYYYQHDKGNSCMRILFDDDDNVFENTWSLKNDTTLRYRSYDRTILKITEDTLITKINDVSSILVKSTIQHKGTFDCDSIRK